MRGKPDFYTRWSSQARKEFFRPGERIGVAVSGGPDSVLLLHFLRGLAAERGFTVAVVHFNHHLRGAESDEDERFVRDLARTLGLEFLRGEADVALEARTRGRNIEATARELRYRFFFSLVNQGQLDRIATAHTANDQAETVLLRLLRGTGTRGLAGIYPLLEGKVVRPFLTLTRLEVMQEVEKRKLAYRVDSSNLDARLDRNKVRLELLPMLQREFNPEVVTLLKELADRARDDEAYLEEQARERANPWRVREGSEEKIPVSPLRDFPPAIRRRVLRQMIQGVRGTLRGITHAHIEALLHFAAEAQSGRSLTLPGGVVARKDFDWLILGPRPRPAAESGFSYPVTVPGELTIPALGSVFRFKIVRPEGDPEAYNSSQNVGLDPRKLRGELRLRNWRAGDCFWPLGSRKRRKLKEFFRQHKVPRDQRKLWPVLESNDEIVWVRGLPPGSVAAPSPESSHIVIIEEEPAPSR